MFVDPKILLVQAGISEGMVVADLGAGVGEYALAAAQLAGDTGTVYACDIRKEMLSKIASEAQAVNLSTVHVVWCDLEEPRGSTLGDGSVDLVIMANALFQIEHRERLMLEAARILRPNGRVLVVDWKDSFSQMGPHTDAVVTEHMAKSLAASAGLTVDPPAGGVLDAGSHHYGFIGRKISK